MHPIERLRYVARSTGLDPGTLAYESAEALADLSFDPQALVIAARRLLDAHLDCGPLWWVAAEILTADDPVATARSLANDLATDPTIEELAAALPGGAHVVLSPSPDLLSACEQRPDLSVDIAELVGREYEAMRALRIVDNAQLVTLDELTCDSDAIAIVPLRAASANGYLLRAADAAFAEKAKANGVAVWATAGVGTILPPALFAACIHRIGVEEQSAPAPTRPIGRHLEEQAQDECSSKLLSPIGDIDVIVGPDGPFLPTPASFRSTCPIPGELCVR